MFLLDTMVARREIENCIEMPPSTLLSEVVDFLVVVLKRAVFKWLYKEQFQNFLELYVRGRMYCFFNKFLIVLGNRSRSESMRGFN